MRRHAISSAWVPSWSFAATMTRALATRKSEVLSFCQDDPRHFAARLGLKARRPISTLAAAFARQHLVHHLAREPEIGGGVAHLLELRAREMPRDIGILRQQIDQRLPARRDLAANVVDEVVRPLAAEMRGQPHHRS